MKIHYFIGCPNQNLALDSRENVAAIDITKITCKTCKAKIMNELIQQNWSELDQALIDRFTQIAQRLYYNDMLDVRARYLK